MIIKYDFVGEIRNDFNGYEKLIDFFNSTKNSSFKNVIVDFQRNNWFEANLTSVLGAILSNIHDKLNTIRLENLSDGITGTFQKNKFLSYFGEMESLYDIHSTTIPYAKFDKINLKEFGNYLEEYLFRKTNLPSMSEGLTKKMKESILEIFINAETHGNCKSVFSCGQLFPHKNRLDFTVVNIGTTIRKNVSDFLNDPYLNSADAIDWAVQESNTTRQGNIPGGLGLSTLLSFIELNKGRVQIVSDDGYWAKISNDYIVKKLSNSFNGTIVNIEFNINDTNTYILSSESYQRNIF